MGFFKNMVRNAVGLAGKTIGDWANAVTGGLAGKVGNLVKDNAGLLGKVAGGIGRAVLSDKARDFLSKAADKALKYIPNGSVKDALQKMNNAAQGRDENYGLKSKSSPQTPTQASPQAPTETTPQTPRKRRRTRKRES